MLRAELDGIIYDIQGIGGISVYHSELLKSRSKDITYKVGLPGETQISPELIDVKKNGINLRRYSSRRIERLRRYAPDEAFQPQVVHTSYYRTLLGPYVPLIVTAHDFIVEVFGAKNLRQRAHVMQKKYSLMKASQIIAISESTRNDLEMLYGQKIADKVTVIPNGISDVFHQIKSSQRKNQAVFVGSRATYKGFNVAVETASLFDDLQLIIVGGGPLSNPERTILAEKLPGRFKHLGYVAQNDLVQIYNESIFLLYPSSYEGFGIPPLEAARCGCVPVVFETSSLTEVVGTKETTLPLGTNPTDIAAHLQAIKPAELDSIRLKGVAFSQQFSWRECALKTEQVYRLAAR